MSTRSGGSCAAPSSPAGPAPPGQLSCWDHRLPVRLDRRLPARRASRRSRTGPRPAPRSSASRSSCADGGPSRQNRSTTSSGTKVVDGLPGLAVVAVVVALAVLDVAGQLRGHRTALAVAGDEVGDVVADHPAEPAALVAGVREVVADVRRARPRRSSATSGSRPAASAAARTDFTVHSTRYGSASWRMNPSAQRPVSSSAFGPVPGHPHRELRAVAAPTGSGSTVPLDVDGAAPRPARGSRASRRSSRARVVGLRPCTRIAESPRPMPQIVRLPYISFSVACSDAMTVQSRVAGLVTIGPTTSRDGPRQHLRVDHVRLLPEHVRVERPAVAEPQLLRAHAAGRRPPTPGGSVCSTSPMSMVAPLLSYAGTGTCRAVRNRPCPAAPRYSPSSIDDPAARQHRLAPGR